MKELLVKVREKEKELLAYREIAAKLPQVEKEFKELCN